MEKRPLVPRIYAICLGIPAVMATVALIALSRNTHQLMAGGPFFVYLIYGWMVLAFNRMLFELDVDGFRLICGPLPDGIRDEKWNRHEVAAVFPRYIMVRGKNWVSHDYYASVELKNGRWVNLRGRYEDWAGASAAAMEIARMWNLPEVSQCRTGAPKKMDWAVLRVVLIWGAAAIGALCWGLFVEIAGLR